MTPATPDAPFSMELCIRTAGLEAGMYISRLDRPWQDAGFAFEGWLVRTEDEVRRVRAACRRVHVDVLRGKSPDTIHVILDDDPEPAAASAAPRRSRIRVCGENTSHLRVKSLTRPTRPLVATSTRAVNMRRMYAGMRHPSCAKYSRIILSPVILQSSLP